MAATSGDGGAACPAYPWPSDGAQRGRKVFMQSDCAACHTMLPYAVLGDEARARAAAVEPKAAEIVVVEEAQRPAAATVNGGANSPDLILISKVLRGNLFAAGGGAAPAAPKMLADAAAVGQELKKWAMASPVWL